MLQGQIGERPMLSGQGQCKGCWARGGLRASAKGDARGAGKCCEGGGTVEEGGLVWAEDFGACWVRLANNLWKGGNYLVLADVE